MAKTAGNHEGVGVTPSARDIESVACRTSFSEFHSRTREAEFHVGGCWRYQNGYACTHKDTGESPLAIEIGSRAIH
jgi:hypothetical protein